MVGMIAAVLTTFSFLPQVLKTVKTKDTSGISLLMYSLSVVGLSLWLVHGVMINDLPLILANSVSVILSAIVLVYKIKYK